MLIETVDIHEIHADPANVRRHPDRNLDAIKASLARFGQQKPLVVDENGIVRAGNGTLEAARAMGWTEINVIRTPLHGSEATAYAIADNRTADLAEWDETALAETLRALQGEGLLEAVGYDEGEVDSLIERLAGEIVNDPQGEWQGMPEFEQEDQLAKYSVKVNFANSEDLADFSRLVGQNVTESTKWIWHPKAETQRHSDKQYAAEVSDFHPE